MFLLDNNAIERILRHALNGGRGEVTGAENRRLVALMRTCPPQEREPFLDAYTAEIQGAGGSQRPVHPVAGRGLYTLSVPPT